MFFAIVIQIIRVSGKDNFRHDLLNLYSLYPQVPVSKLGFTDGWEKGPIWK